MPTKTKTAGSTNSTPAKSLETLFSEALELVNQKHHDKAIAAFEALLAEVADHGHVGMARSVRTYLSVLRAKAEKTADVAATPVLEAQVWLNRGEADHALELLDKALKADGQDARLFYLKASAHAQKDEVEAAAEALKKAVTMNQDLVHQYRLERDFDRVRSSGSFAALGLD